MPGRAEEMLDRVEEHVSREVHSGKAGWCRVNFNYFISDEEAEFIIRALEQVATDA